jgi:acetoin utilization deacetylase AcuC-like enzyme
VEQLLALDGEETQLDADTAMSPRSAQAALKAAGAGVQLVERLLDGTASNGFALVRPPGHHAERTHAMGFCLFNNVAVAAEAARQRVDRVLVVDWDVHHGNGTQSAFYGRADVLFMSAHQSPLYPGSGAAREVGSGEGLGYTVNCPLPPGQSDADYGAVFERLFLPVARAFRPELILVSAGFDPHRADPLGGMDVTERGFAAMCSALQDLAREQCQGRLGLLLEGGYDLDGLSGSVHACLEVLTGQRRETFPGHSGRSVDAAVAAAVRELAPSWPDALHR